MIEVFSVAEVITTASKTILHTAKKTNCYLDNITVTRLELLHSQYDVDDYDLTHLLNYPS